MIIPDDFERTQTISLSYMYIHVFFLFIIWYYFDTCKRLGFPYASDLSKKSPDSARKKRERLYLIHTQHLQNLLQLKTTKRTCATEDKGLTHFYDDIIDIFYI